MMEAWKRGETVTLRAEFRDPAGDLYDPDTSISASLWGPSGTAVFADTTMTQESTGVYYLDWASAADSDLGCYRAMYSSVNSGRISKGDDYFTLEDASVPPMGWCVMTLADQLRAEMDQNADAAGGAIPDRVAKIVREQGRWLFDYQDWLFRKTPGTLTVAAGATEVDMPADFKELDANTMRVTDDSSYRLVWTEDASAWQEAKSIIGANASAGYPRAAVLYRTNGAWKAKLWPAADKEYTYDFWYIKSSPWSGTSPIADNIHLAPNYWTEDFDEGWYKLCAYHVLSRFRSDDSWKGFKSEFTAWLKAHDMENNETISVALEPVDDVMMDFQVTAQACMNWLPGGSVKWYGST